MIRSAHSLGLDAVAVFTEPDALSSHVHDADEAVCLGASPREYTNTAKLMEAIKSTGYALVSPPIFTECVIWAHMVHDSLRVACLAFRWPLARCDHFLRLSALLHMPCPAPWRVALPSPFLKWFLHGCLQGCGGPPWLWLSQRER